MTEPWTKSGRALLEDFHGEEACVSECWHAEAILAIEREAATVSPEPHEDSANAEIAARVLRSEWHDHSIDDGRGHKFIWRHRHEAITAPLSEKAGLR